MPDIIYVPCVTHRYFLGKAWLLASQSRLRTEYSIQLLFDWHWLRKVTRALIRLSASLNDLVVAYFLGHQVFSSVSRRRSVNEFNTIFLFIKLQVLENTRPLKESPKLARTKKIPQNCPNLLSIRHFKSPLRFPSLMFVHMCRIKKINVQFSFTFHESFAKLRETLSISNSIACIGLSTFSASVSPNSLDTVQS